MVGLQAVLTEPKPKTREPKLSNTLKEGPKALSRKHHTETKSSKPSSITLNPREALL